jgi:hypothetical protein
VFLGLKGRGDFGADDIERDPVFRGRHRRIEAVGQGPDDALLFLEDRAARRLGGVRREDRLDQDVIEQFLQPFAVEASGTQILEGLLQALDLWRLAPDLAFAEPPDAMDLFGQVDDLEEGREGAHQLTGVRRRQGMQALAQIVGRVGFAAAATDGGAAHGLDVLEERGTQLFVDDLANEVAQLTDILAQGRILGGGGLLITRIGCGYHGNLLGDAIAGPAGGEARPFTVPFCSLSMCSRPYFALRQRLCHNGSHSGMRRGPPHPSFRSRAA